MRLNNFRFSFQPVNSSQNALIRDWIIQKHISEWLHGDGLKNTLDDLDKFCKGGGSFRHWIAYDNDIPFAYLLTSTLQKGSIEVKEAITLDLFICRLDYLGKGFAVQLIHEFLMSQFSDIEEIYIDPEVKNARAVHVYKKAGFRIVNEFIASWHPVPHYNMMLSMQNLKTDNQP